MSVMPKHLGLQPRTSGGDEGESGTSNWSTYNRPAVRSSFVRRSDDGSEVADLLIQGVHCAACTWRIENSLLKHPAVVSMEVNPVTTRAQLRWNPAQAELPDLLQRIAALGFKPMPFASGASRNAVEEERRLALRRLLVAGLGMMQVMSFAIAIYAGAFQGMDAEMEAFFRLISLLVATPIVVYSGAPFFAGAWRTIRSRTPGMDIPVALAIGSAWGASVWNTLIGGGEIYFDSAVMFVFFLSGTRYLEAAGRYRALDLTHALAQYLPATARRITADGIEEVGVVELQAGDRVLVAQGTAFPADGILQANAARVDESMLTGESMAVSKLPGDAVIAGTVNLDAAVQMTVEKTGPDTVLAGIGQLVNQASQAKPRFLQLTDRIASYIVLAILMVATVTGFSWWYIDPARTFEIVLTVLVVTCPCALAIATPAAFAFATGRLARDGFLVRRAGALPVLAKASRVMFDKTGTLTLNSLRVTRAVPRDGYTGEQTMAFAAALEAHSAHPIARAFQGHAAGLEARDVIAIEGGGLEGLINGQRWRIGNHHFVSALAPAGASAETDSQRPPGEAQRLVYLGNSEGLIARFEIAEDPRPGAGELLTALRQQGITSAIASGDQSGAVAALATTLGVDEWRAHLLPADKLAWLQELQHQGERVVAIGDGVNDSPLLAGADVSIAMGSGTSIAHHSADCVWLGSSLAGLEQVFTLAGRTMRIVRQNMIWALSYNVLAIPLAVSGQIAPWMAALGMSLSSLLVTLNALRLSAAPGREMGATDSAETQAEAGFSQQSPTSLGA